MAVEQQAMSFVADHPGAARPASDHPAAARPGAERSWSRRLLRRIDERSARIGIIGLGYVGVPLALAAVEAGFAATGFDIDRTRVARLNEGESYIKHIPSARIAEAVEGGHFAATEAMRDLAEMDVVIICVPTPVTRYLEPDLGAIEGAARHIRDHLRPGQLVVLESTTYPGTTTGMLRQRLEESGLQSQVDFFLAYSPEREDPGNPNFSTATIPKVIGGDGEEAVTIAQALYEALVVKTVRVSSPAVAEAVKLTENIFRSVNIALVNELKTAFAAMGIDVWEVIEAARTKPFGYMAFYPGPGVGGHCIPVDPYYLTWKLREFEMSVPLVELASEINRTMPLKIVNGVAHALDAARGLGLAGRRLLLLGVAYKKNIDDMRDSPALRIIELLEARGAVVDYHDPHVALIPPLPEFARLAGRASAPLDVAAVRACDAVVIVTDHDDVDYRMIAEHAELILDTRNAYARRGIASDRIVKL